MKQLKNKFLGLTAITMTVIALLSTNTTQAQDFGADVVSSYVWRGTQFGTGPHIQPWMELGPLTKPGMMPFTQITLHLRVKTIIRCQQDTIQQV